MRWDICKTFFSDFGCNFLLLGGVFHKCSKNKYQSIHQNKFFGTHFVCEKHPLHVFCFFPPLCMPIFKKKNHLPIFGELRKLHSKKFMFSVKIGREINFQSWLLYDCFFHSCYNFAIVQCCENIQWKSLQRLSLTRRTIGLVISCGAIGGLQSYSVDYNFMHWECSGEHKA